MPKFPYTQTNKHAYQKHTWKEITKRFCNLNFIKTINKGNQKGLFSPVYFKSIQKWLKENEDLNDNR